MKPRGWDNVFKEIRKERKKIEREYEEKAEVASFFVCAAGILIFWVCFIFFR